jgi:hypothetical protein
MIHWPILTSKASGSARLTTKPGRPALAHAPASPQLARLHVRGRGTAQANQRDSLTVEFRSVAQAAPAETRAAQVIFSTSS